MFQSKRNKFELAARESERTKMKINAKVRGEWILIPCKQNESTIAWLGKESLSRYRVMKKYDEEDEVYEIRKTPGGSLLYPNDLLVDILDENDFVHVGRYKLHVINLLLELQCLKM